MLGILQAPSVVEVIRFFTEMPNFRNIFRRSLVRVLHQSLETHGRAGFSGNIRNVEKFCINEHYHAVFCQCAGLVFDTFQHIRSGERGKIIIILAAHGIMNAAIDKLRPFEEIVRIEFALFFRTGVSPRNRGGIFVGWDGGSFLPFI